MIAEIGSVLVQLGAVVHGGALFAFALLFRYRRHIGGIEEAHLVRVYRAWGAGNGLSLAAWVYGSILRFPGSVNPGKSMPWSYLPNFGDAPLASAAALLLLALWVSYISLEIWTLDPCRLLDKDGVVAEPEPYAAAVRRVSAHLGVNALLVLAIAILTGLGGRL